MASLKSFTLTCIAMINLGSLGACSGIASRLDPNIVSARGLNPEVEKLNYGQIADLQDELIQQLKRMSGLKDIPLAARDPNWELVMKSGISMVGGQCNEYLAALFHFDRDNRSIRSGLTATGTATTTLMGLAGAAASPIAAMAAVFGLGTTFFDANVNAVVFQVGPAAVRNIVVKSQDTYRDSVMSNMKLYHSRPDVIIGLQGYLQLCTPVAIESAVEAGASAITFDLKGGSSTQDSQPPLELGSDNLNRASSLPAHTQILVGKNPPLRSTTLKVLDPSTVTSRKSALMHYVRVLAAGMKPSDSLAQSELHNIAVALKAPLSDDVADQRDKILIVIQATVNSSDPDKAIAQMQALSKSLEDAGIHQQF